MYRGRAGGGHCIRESITYLRYFLKIAYNGANYCGWQIQNDQPTVQARMEEALSTILREKIQVMGCGRTDTGVHAKEFYLHFDTGNEVSQELVPKLNGYLGRDISVYKIIPVDTEAHARFDATARTYKYYMHFHQDPFLTDLSYFVYPKPDIDLMREASQFLLNYTDYHALCKKHHSGKTTICYVSDVDWYWTEETGQLVFKVTANRFLRNMVRMIVGSMLMIGKGKMTIEHFKEVMDVAGTFKYIEAVAPYGLYLVSVDYPYITK